VQFVEHPLHFLAVGHPLFSRLAIIGYLVDVGRIGLIGHYPPLQQLANDDATGHDRQIGGEAALAAKSAECGKIVGKERGKYFRRQVLEVLRCDANRTRLGRVVHDVDDQAQESIDEIFPGPRLARETALEQLAVDVGESHAVNPRVGHIQPRGSPIGPRPRACPEFDLFYVARPAETRLIAPGLLPGAIRAGGGTPIDAPGRSGYDPAKWFVRLLS
jgi:hypothetical protein